MDKAELANFVLFIIDAAVGVFLVITIFGFSQKKIFALGRFYILESEKTQYWQVVIGYVLIILLLLYFRFFEFPERLFPYLLN
jgi:hypothetical protein